MRDALHRLTAEELSWKVVTVLGENQTSFKQLHNILMDTRNEYLAHAGVSNSEKIYASANFNIHESDVSMKLSYEIIGQYGLSSKDLFEFLELIKYLLPKTIAKRDEASKTYLDSLTLVGKNEILKKAIEKKKHANKMQMP